MYDVGEKTIRQTNNATERLADKQITRQNDWQTEKREKSPVIYALLQKDDI